MFKDVTSKPSGKKFSLKKLWKKFRSNKKTNAATAALDAIDKPNDNLPSCSCDYVVGPKDVVTNEKVGDGFDIDIHEVDKDRIRTSCKEVLDNPPVFPSREEIKEKIENAHKYYGIKCLYNQYAASEDNDDEKELQPTWYFILERPLVEQYVLMNNYIRKLSAMASLKCERLGVAEEPAIEEEVSSISSCSDYSDFAPDSEIAKKLKEMKKLRVDPSPEGVTGFKELRELKEGTKRVPQFTERTVKTTDYSLIIREPVKDEEEEVLPSVSNAIELSKVEGRTQHQMNETALPGSSGDHLPDITDFDLSHNLVVGPIENQKRGFRQAPYYHWQGNSSPTKTPLLVMDSQPPVSPRAPGTPVRDFLSFRNLSLSSEFYCWLESLWRVPNEFVDSWRDPRAAFAKEYSNTCVKEITGIDDLDEVQVSSATGTAQISRNPVLSLEWKDTQMNYNNPLPGLSSTEQTEQNDIIERAALASDYIRECLNQGATEAEDILPIDEDKFLENLSSEEDLLKRSASQTDAYSDFTELESASSMETQITARPLHP